MKRYAERYLPEVQRENAQLREMVARVRHLLDEAESALAEADKSPNRFVSDLRRALDETP